MEVNMNTTPFNQLVKLVARAFYDDINFNTNPKPGRSDNKGIAVVILDALTRYHHVRQWVKEDDLARELKLDHKLVRRTIVFLEEQKLVNRDQKKEKTGKEGDINMNGKVYTQYYCCLNYAQIYDIVRYRLLHMKMRLRDEIGDGSSNIVEEYVCPNCPGRRYTALDALALISPVDEHFHCENCDAILSVSDKMGGGGTDGERFRVLERKMDVELKPLTEQLARIKDLMPPDFESLQEWEAKVASEGTTMGYSGEPEIEVVLSSGVNEEDVQEHIEAPMMKVLPPWMMPRAKG